MPQARKDHLDMLSARRSRKGFQILRKISKIFIWQKPKLLRTFHSCQYATIEFGAYFHQYLEFITRHFYSTQARNLKLRSELQHSDFLAILDSMLLRRIVMVERLVEPVVSDSGSYSVEARHLPIGVDTTSTTCVVPAILAVEKLMIMIARRSSLTDPFPYRLVSSSQSRVWDKTF